MNSCRRLTCSDWRSGLSVVFSRTNCRRRPEVAASFNRSQTTAAKHAAGSDTGEKPRLKAIDLAQKIRQGKTNPRATTPPMSAQQKRVMELKQTTLQLQNVHPNVLAKHLHKSLLYQDKDVVIINKPYGIPVRDDTGGMSITSVLPVLAKMLDGMKVNSDTQLFPCLGLEKEATGILLLAKREEVVEHILKHHRNNQVERKYWVVTVGTPVPSEGLIDIPIIEKSVTGPQPHFKMALSPCFRMNDAGTGVTKVRGHRQAHAAVTKYQVLDSRSGCSLVELQPLTVEKHQMRVHMAFALSCGILGDHKYSHWNKLAPQKLPERVLGKLGMEQSKIRHLPLHLHARQLTMPGTAVEEINVTCHLPKFFSRTVKSLVLTLPEKKG